MLPVCYRSNGPTNDTVTAEADPELADSMPELSIIIPCLNERPSIAECVRVALAALERYDIDGEIIVIDNGSTDGSAEEAAQAGAKVVTEDRRGKGRAVRVGIAASSAQYLVMSDGDGTYDLLDLQALMEPLRDGFDMVIGDRMKGTMAPGAMPWHHRYIGNPVLNVLMTLATRRWFGDCLSGLRGFTRAAWNEMALTSNGFELESEMCIQAARNRLRVTTFPINYAPRRAPSKLSSVKHGFAIASFIIRNALPAPFRSGSDPKPQQ